jgi:hypothetical protein
MAKKTTFHQISNVEVLENEGVYFDDHKDNIKAEVEYMYNNQKNIHAKDLVKTLTKKQRDIDIVYEQPQRLKQYKVDEELSLEEKLEAGWEKEKIKIVLNKQVVEITMLKKELPGKAKHAYVREFLDGVPEEYI